MMMKRFLELNEFLNPLDKDIALHIPSAAEMIINRDPMINLEKIESITKKLQEDHVDLFTVRTLFDRVLEEFPNTSLNHDLGRGKDSLTHYTDFEVGIVKNISGAPLSKTQKEALKGLLDLRKDNTQDTSVDYETSTLNAKKRKHSRAVDWVPGTSNKAERLFSKAGYILTYHRKKIMPMNLEGQIFLHANKTFWNLATVNEIRQ